MDDSDESNDIGDLDLWAKLGLLRCLRRWKCAVVAFLIFGPGLLYLYFPEMGEQDGGNPMSKLISDPLIMMLLVSVFPTVLAIVITIALIVVGVRFIPSVQRKIADLIAPAVLSTIKEDLQNFAGDGLLKQKETLEAMEKQVEKLSSQMTKAETQSGKTVVLTEEAGKQIKNAGQENPSQSD